ncbi:8-oxo-dGTP diphosphatase [Ornithinibacillus halophilus]|uniref:8-oxo-dGTP diphosphatase n=1 Tax=Ornithinibacillus halophilus TaxID=930117 RepID=A0A1M5F1E2_9BACI|nr:8-oxo-dGTP diphosphatase [Ornithinibacillus halophilus]SHF85324.1 8-oxo-dGTP diphosphatase [Ornithinibacillus halophilus]
MQRVTNCIVIKDEHILLLKKPRRGWYAMPGGKMEQGETIKDAAIREYWEETDLTLDNPKLAGVFTFSIFDKDELQKEWMMFTFVSESYQGTLTKDCDEGELEWVPIDKINTLPMAEGDRKIFQHVLSSNKNEILYGAFSYTEEYELLSCRLDPPIQD